MGVKNQHCFPWQERANTDLPMSEVIALVPEMKSSASLNNQSRDSPLTGLRSQSSAFANMDTYEMQWQADQGQWEKVS